MSKPNLKTFMRNEAGRDALFLSFINNMLPESTKRDQEKAISLLSVISRDGNLAKTYETSKVDAVSEAAARLLMAKAQQDISAIFGVNEDVKSLKGAMAMIKALPVMFDKNLKPELSEGEIYFVVSENGSAGNAICRVMDGRKTLTSTTDDSVILEVKTEDFPVFNVSEKGTDYTIVAYKLGTPPQNEPEDLGM